LFAASSALSIATTSPRFAGAEIGGEGGTSVGVYDGRPRVDLMIEAYQARSEEHAILIDPSSELQRK
jgi:hypothetical protein